MPDVQQHIADIQSKVQLLLKQHAALQKENAVLKASIRQWEASDGKHNESLQLLIHQNQILKASLQTLDPEEKKQFLQKINGYLKQIDQCISLLSK